MKSFYFKIILSFFLILGIYGFFNKKTAFAAIDPSPTSLYPCIFGTIGTELINLYALDDAMHGTGQGYCYPNSEVCGTASTTGTETVTISWPAAPVKEYCAKVCSYVNYTSDGVTCGYECSQTVSAGPVYYVLSVGEASQTAASCYSVYYYTSPQNYTIPGTETSKTISISPNKKYRWTVDAYYKYRPYDSIPNSGTSCLFLPVGCSTSFFINEGHSLYNWDIPTGVFDTANCASAWCTDDAECLAAGFTHGSSGGSICIDDNTLITCGDSNGDSCLEKTNTSYCDSSYGTNYTCQGSNCVCVPTQTCNAEDICIGDPPCNDGCHSPVEGTKDCSNKYKGWKEVEP